MLLLLFLFFRCAYLIVINVLIYYECVNVTSFDHLTWFDLIWFTASFGEQMFLFLHILNCLLPFFIFQCIFFFFRLMISRCACCLWLCETDWKIFTCCKLIIVVVPFTFIMIFLIVFLVKVNIFKVFIVFIFVVVYKTSTVDCQINWLRIVIWQQIALVTIVSTLQV